VAVIGARIRRLRGSESQLQFARRLGITREHLSRIESGAQPGTEILRSLAEVTGVSLDFLVLGAGPELREEAMAGGGGWEAAIEPLLGGTSLRLTRAPAVSRRRADRAWQELPEERKDDIRALARQAGLVAVAIEALLPAKAAKSIVEELGEALTSLLVARIAGTGRPLS